MLLEGPRPGQSFWIRQDLIDALSDYPPRITGDALGYLVQRNLATTSRRRLSVDSDGGIETQEVDVILPSRRLAEWVRDASNEST